MELAFILRSISGPAKPPITERDIDKYWLSMAIVYESGKSEFNPALCKKPTLLFTILLTPEILRFPFNPILCIKLEGCYYS